MRLISLQFSKGKETRRHSLAVDTPFLLRLDRRGIELVRHRLVDAHHDVRLVRAQAEDREGPREWTYTTCSTPPIRNSRTYRGRTRKMCPRATSHHPST
jgi:hypothetical protein